MPPKRAKTTAAAASQATPARSGRNRTNTPLPSVSTRANYAYGSQGKAVLNTQLRTTEQSGFNEAFEATRDEDAVESDRAPSPPAHHQRRQDTGAQPAQPVVENMQDPVGRNATRVDAAAEYASGIRDAGVEMRQPPREQRSWTKILCQVLRILLGLVSGVLLLHIPLSYRMMAARDSFSTGLGLLLRTPPFHLEPAYIADLYYRFKHDEMWKDNIPSLGEGQVLQTAINTNFWNRFDVLEKRLDAAIADFNSRLSYFVPSRAIHQPPR